MSAWERVSARYRGDPAALDAALARFSGPTYARPLRSWALVLRANDKRIDDDNARGVVAVDRALVRTCCAPNVIRSPGVSLDAAARVFGVNRTTVARWASPADDGTGAASTWWQAVKRQMQADGNGTRRGVSRQYRVRGRRLALSHFHNAANPKRSETRVWTPGFFGLDAGGEVWSGAWGELRAGLADRVPGHFEQRLERVDRRLGTTGRCASPATRGKLRSRVWQWVCPEGDGGCGRLVYKLYLPMPNWTLLAALGGVDEPVDRHGLAFRCLRCAGLIYESAERTSSPGVRRDGARRRVDVWDRFVKRVSGGVLTGREV